jgi:hypothetical protein
MHPVVTYSSTYVPALPNTGFQPTIAAALTVAALLVVAAAVFVAPFVRKTLVSIFK